MGIRPVAVMLVAPPLPPTLSLPNALTSFGEFVPFCMPNVL
jgi:hypothetical protein